MATEAEILAAIVQFQDKKSELEGVKDKRDRAVVERQQIVAALQTLQADVDRLQLEVQTARQFLKDLL